MQFSIIIPCYNSATTIVRALDSATHQVYKGVFEIIVVDDCSNDNTRQIVSEYIKKTYKPIRLFINQVNSGPGFSRNRAIKEAEGLYIAFMDSDDYLENDLLQLVEEKINLTGADIVYYGNNHIIGHKHIHYPGVPRHSKEDYIALSAGSLCKFVSKKSLWKEIDIPSIYNSEDIAVIPLLFEKANKIETIKNCLYNYVHSNTSTSSKYSVSVSENFLTSWKYTFERIDINKCHDSIEFHGIKTIIYGATLNALKANVDSNIITNYWNIFEKDFPYWFNNKYISYLPITKRLFLFCVHNNIMYLLRIYSKIHTLILKYL